MADFSNPKNFGFSRYGKPIDLYKLQEENMELEVITYGAIIKSLKVPNRTGSLVDVVLGCDTMADYENDTCYMGCIVGRVANRIKNGEFNLNQHVYKLKTNDHPNHLHGGEYGFNTKVWEVISYKKNEITLRYQSPDGEEGYPGQVDATVTYRLSKHLSEYVFTLETQINTTQSCPVNLTNHTYFNLAGCHESNVYDHQIVINSDKYLPTDENCLVTGEIRDVDGTLYDLRMVTNVGERICQLIGSGKPAFDSYYCLTKKLKDDNLMAATLESSKSGIRMVVKTNEEGFQFYSAHFLKHDCGKGNRQYDKYNGLCFECQGYPDAVNNSHFPSIIANPGQIVRRESSFCFSTVD